MFMNFLVKIIFIFIINLYIDDRQIDRQCGAQRKILYVQCAMCCLYRHPGGKKMLLQSGNFLKNLIYSHSFLKINTIGSTHTEKNEYIYIRNCHGLRSEDPRIYGFQQNSCPKYPKIIKNNTLFLELCVISQVMNAYSV